MPHSPVLEVERVSKQFAEVQAVGDISLTVDRGEIVGFLGPNGAGKTTTLRMILGIFHPDSGRVSFVLDGASCPALPRERTGYLPEERGLVGDARLLDLLSYYGELKGLARSDARRRSLFWLDRFDLADRAASKVEKLSKGMQQKVQFAAAVLHEPDVLVLDEPFSGLDPVNQDLLHKIVIELRDRGTAILLSSHRMNLVEELCDRILLIHRGRCVLQGDLDEIKETHGEHVVSIRFDGDPSGLLTLPGLSNIQTDGDHATFTLLPGTEPDAFVRNLPPQIVVRALRVDRPPLHDVFIRAVEGDGVRGVKGDGVRAVEEDSA